MSPAVRRGYISPGAGTWAANEVDFWGLYGFSAEFSKLSASLAAA